MARDTLSRWIVQTGQCRRTIFASRGMNYPTRSCYWDRIS